MVSQTSATPSGNTPSVSQTPQGPISEISGTYAGRIVSVSEEGGAKQAVIDFALGRMRVTLPPELTEALGEGDLLKLLFQGGNLRLEKRPLVPPGYPTSEKLQPAFTPEAVTFTPSAGAPMIRDLIDFEEALIRFLSAQTGKTLSSDSRLPLPTLPGYAPTPKNSPALPASLTPEALPVLLLRVLESPGGKEYLAGQIRTLNPDLLKSITTTLARLDPPAVSVDPRDFVDLLRGFRGALSEAFTSTTVKSTFESVPTLNISNGLVPLENSVEDKSPMSAARVTSAPLDTRSMGPAVGANIGAALVAAQNQNKPATPTSAPVIPSSVPAVPASPLNPSRDIHRYLKPVGGGTESFLGRGLVVSRELAAPVPALSLPSETAASIPSPFRYRLDLGGTTVEAYSPERREPGEFVVFKLDRMENNSGNSVARFRDPESLLPPVLRTDYAAAGPAGKTALLLAADTVKPFLEEPGFPEAVRDFSRLLVDSGRLQGPGVSMPESDELDALFKLMIAFPRDAASPTLQARAWGEVVRNPGGFEALLRLFRPEHGLALLDPQSSLRPLSPELANPGERPSWTPRPGELPIGFPPELPGLLEKALAEKSGPRHAGMGAGLELRWDTALQADKAQTVFESGPSARPVHAGGLEKFLNQAFSVLAPREEDWKEGQSRTLYFFHGDEWKRAEARWSSNSGTRGEKALKPVDRPPMRVDISLQTENLGSVRASLSLDRKGSKLDFRSERADARDLLAQSIHPLEYLLRDLDLRLASWTYTQLTAPLPNLANDERAAVPATDPSSTLDIFG